MLMYPDKIQIESTRRSPWVVFEPGRIFVMGRSIIENPSRFYEPGLKWVSGLKRKHSEKTKIDLGFEYINTGSIKWLYMLLKELSDTPSMSENMTINWYYEQGDDDMLELGYIFQSLVDCPFSIIEIDELNDDICNGFLQQRN